MKKIDRDTRTARFPTALKEILGEFNKDGEWAGKLKVHKVFDYWDEVVGEEISRISAPHLIREKVLWVNVTDSVWIHHLHLTKNILLEALNQRLGTVLLVDIRFRSDPSVEKELKKKESPPVTHRVTQPDPDKLSRFERMTSSIPDKELRQTLIRAWTKLEIAKGEFKDQE
jgi:hypothetical protein